MLALFATSALAGPQSEQARTNEPAFLPIREGNGPKFRFVYRVIKTETVNYQSVESGIVRATASDTYHLTSGGDTWVGIHASFSIPDDDDGRFYYSYKKVS